ncbi:MULTISPECIES: hypothetical protein [unclassified Microbacterium]|uniref:hypothetical protein n=1 Tax=unclassified Microbacterium TaxID=2609290 RepID=UPI00214AD7AE|nr:MULTISPECIES: hypothetical protein [unclassified Microbacterium]MCR2801930.1 hypothetical protein [Microbacterium sp. zg.Y818]MCR2824224.1 hypothetical protein [Microbacterium sp. zg.Y909]WIM22812.1 hypothetical protein QNO21_01890 [Microbacterium sp. zg-Y818]
MKIKSIKAATAATLLAAALTVAVPTVAHAAYVIPEGDVSISSPTVAPGGVVQVAVEDGYFAGGSTVDVSLTGENANGASLAFVKFAVQTADLGSVTAAADGSVSTGVRLPSNAVGTYTIVLSGVDADGNPVTASVSVSVPAAGGTGGETLPTTGGDTSALLGLWIGGGALLLAGGGLAVASTVRRHRQQAAV